MKGKQIDEVKLAIKAATDEGRSVTLRSRSCSHLFRCGLFYLQHERH